jgi:hypothetical protein
MQIRYSMIAIGVGVLVWLSYVLFSYGIDKSESWAALLSLIALVIDLIFLVKFGRPKLSPNTYSDVSVTNGSSN